MQQCLIEVTQLRIDRCHCGNCVTLAEGEDVLPATGWVFDIEPEESAVEEGYQWDGRGECAAGVQSAVDCIAALFQRKDADVGVLDGEQLEDARTQEVVSVQ